MRYTRLSLASVLFSCAYGQLYINPDIYTPSNFFDKFNFATANDPTNGYVDYVSRVEATSAGLIATRSNSVIFRADNTTVPPQGSRGRKSIRLEGTARYTHGLFIADFQHMPGNACGAWPSFWTLGDDWFAPMCHAQNVVG